MNVNVARLRNSAKRGQRGSVVEITRSDYEEEEVSKVKKGRSGRRRYSVQCEVKKKRRRREKPKSVKNNNKKKKICLKRTISDAAESSVSRTAARSAQVCFMYYMGNRTDILPLSHISAFTRYSARASIKIAESSCRRSLLYLCRRVCSSHAACYVKI